MHTIFIKTKVVFLQTFTYNKTIIIPILQYGYSMTPNINQNQLIVDNNHCKLMTNKQGENLFVSYCIYILLYHL